MCTACSDLGSRSRNSDPTIDARKPSLKTISTLKTTTLHIGRVCLTSDAILLILTTARCRRLRYGSWSDSPHAFVWGLPYVIGETGVGKTTIMQKLAERLGAKLVVQNLNVQSEASDLIAGIRPLRMKRIARSVYDEFLRLFPMRFRRNSNAPFLSAMAMALEKGQWKRLCKGFVTFADFAMTGKRKRSTASSEEGVEKYRRRWLVSSRTGK